MTTAALLSITPHMQSRRWKSVRRLAGSAGPLLFFLLVGCVLMVPFFPQELLISPGGDLMNHVCGIVEATNGLASGQFPLRTAPTVHDQQQYPFFSFYGNLPYTLGGLFCLLLKVGPYTAYKLVLLTGYTIGGWYTYRSGLWLTRRPGAALVAGAAFVTAPYAFTDFHARAAFTEAFSMGVMPACLFYALRCFSRRGRPGDMLASGVAWSAVSLSHNLTYLFGGTFVCLMFLMTAAPTKAWVGRMLRVGAGFGLGVVLTLWYLAPALALVPKLRIALADAGLPFCAETLTSLNVLLSPTALTPPLSSTPHMDLQIGWTMLIAALVTICLLLLNRWLPAGRRSARGARLTIALLATFLLTCFASWSPDREMWSYLPRTFWHVQSSSRLLLYTAVFGSLLVAIAAAAVTPRGKSGWMVSVVLLLSVAWAAQTFVSFRERWVEGMEAHAVATPSLGGNGGSTAYLLQPAVTNATTILHPDVNLATQGFGLIAEQFVEPELGVELPAPPSGSEVEVVGTVSNEVPLGVRVRAFVDNQPMTSEVLPPGPFSIRLPMPRNVEGKRIKFRLHTDLAGGQGGFVPASADYPSMVLAGVYFRTPTGQPVDAYLPSTEVRVSRRTGGGMRWRQNLRADTLVQLPIFYYPGMMQVTDKGKPIAFGNIGPLVALRLGAGSHDIRTQFVGVTWANWSSLGGWGIVFVGSALLLHRRLKRRRQAVGVSRTLTIGSVGAIAAAIAFGLTLTLPHVMATLNTRWSSGSAFAVEASRALTEPRYAAASAFDGDPTTAWVVGGAEGNVRLTIRPERPARLSRIQLDARWTDFIQGWHQIRLDYYRGDKLIRQHLVNLPDAHRNPQAEVKDLPRIEADRIEFTFSNPIVRSRDESRTIPVAAAQPGYTELRLIWK